MSDSNILSLINDKTRSSIGGVIVFFGVWFYLTPHLTVVGMKAATEANDASRLSGYVNFPALKENLKTSFNAKLAPEAAKGKKPNLFASLEGKMTAAIINPMIDTLVTPENLLMMMKGDKPQSVKSTTRPKPSSSKDTETSMSYESFDRFVVTVKKKGSTDEPVGLVFNRESLFSWKLSALRLPMLSK